MLGYRHKRKDFVAKAMVTTVKTFVRVHLTV